MTTSYVRTTVYLSDNQLSKIRTAAKAGREVTIRIDPGKRSNQTLYLTATQARKTRTSNTPVNIKLSKSQLGKQGGFIFTIPALLAGIGAAAGTASAAAGIAKAVQSNKHNKKIESETRRHNVVVEKLMQAKRGGGGKKKSVRGTGVFVPFGRAEAQARRRQPLIFN
jgi:hypothetical protein